MFVHVYWNGVWAREFTLGGVFHCSLHRFPLDIGRVRDDASCGEQVDSLGLAISNSVFWAAGSVVLFEKSSL
ncbi:hypothetical protein DSO57_1031086 [Entomophthora muscae]|uniref:Uncharacterized protein n=1 Tax=Entomophthora muscae TaxID=34485 RepID=A0ACC2UAI0_9FUNG|nr:hypothetical protein DSO57_1031086 [Entomophthora muscae]